MTPQSPIQAPHYLQPEGKQDNKEQQQLLEIHDQHGQGNGGSLGHCKFLADGPQVEPAFPLAKLAFYGIALPLVVSKLPLRFCDKFWIIPRAAKAGTTQSNAVALAESSIGASAIDLISTDHFWVVTVAAALGSRLSLQVFSFVVGITAEPIKEGKAIACHRDGYLGPEPNIAPRLAAHDRSDMSLVQTDDPVGKTPALGVIKNALLATQFTHYH